MIFYKPDSLGRKVVAENVNAVILMSIWLNCFPYIVQ